MILPPLVIKNCLPIPISITLQLDKKTEEEMKSNMRQEINTSFLKKDTMVIKMDEQSVDNQLINKKGTKRVEGEDYLNLGVKNFARGEEQYFEELYTLSSSVDILIQLKKGLYGQGLRLKQANTTLESHQ